MKYVFCQFDTRYLYRDTRYSLANEYYTEFWGQKAKDGYYKPDEFWEIPTWITEIDGILEKYGHTSELKIISSDSDFDFIKTGKWDMNNTVFLFSVLDINKQEILEIHDLNYYDDYSGDMLPVNIVCGGYIDGREYFQHSNNISWVDSIAEFCEDIESMPYSHEVSYRLFDGVVTIPRLTMSTGCLHNCKFCCVNKNLIEYSDIDIQKQISAMESLDFELVYINDKTFGQCENYQNLAFYKIKILKYNPKFKGFIIQTTAQKCKDLGFCVNLKALGVRIVEIGVETYNDRLLKEYRKPHNKNMIDKSFINLSDVGMEIIPNIIIGLIGESIHTYRNTLQFLRTWDIYSINIYNLVIYEGTELYTKTGFSDSNEMEVDRAYHDETAKQAVRYFYNELFNYGKKILWF